MKGYAIIPCKGKWYLLELPEAADPNLSGYNWTPNDNFVETPATIISSHPTGCEAAIMLANILGES